MFAVSVTCLSVLYIQHVNITNVSAELLSMQVEQRSWLNLWVKIDPQRSADSFDCVFLTASQIWTEMNC